MHRHTSSRVALARVDSTRAIAGWRRLVVMASTPRREEALIHRARRENRDTAHALAQLWRERTERLTRDLERARETYEEIKTELFRARECARAESARRVECEEALEGSRRETRLKSKEAATAETNARAMREAVEGLEGEVEALRSDNRTLRERVMEREEAMEVARAEAREAAEGERRRRETAERRREKSEKQMKSVRDAAEAKSREMMRELERERGVRARLEEERTEFEADRRRFRDFDAQLAAERVKVVEAHSAGKLAADALKEQLNKAENEALALRRMMEARSTEMANAVRSLNEELAVQHDIVERGMSARVDALRDAYDDEANRIRERANVSIDAARKSVTEANERVSRMEETCARAEAISRDALAKLKNATQATVEAEEQCERLRANMHAMGDINAKLTRRIIDGEPFVLDDELEESAKMRREPVDDFVVKTPSPMSENPRKTARKDEPVRYDARDVQHVHKELEDELAMLRVEHDAIVREIGDSSTSEGEMLTRALEDAQTRLEAKARQVKMLNSTSRHAT